MEHSKLHKAWTLLQEAARLLDVAAEEQGRSHKARMLRSAATTVWSVEREVMGIEQLADDGQAP